ncbi:hypothetical protein TH53_07410 [Pedobacter lusitanus]|uniref:Uncharacterized protein n=1 Tax=Pedobacter lusitanus TaxID=1503925 RepID=A0A0D0GNL4_9SPHI|nr:DUF6266 family protein [Pedobacter lusitanus]KIO77750.1 hypothetical protein TH53_07410 [Pedobacter lusitanus]
MAIIQEGTVLAGIRGKIGNVVIYTWKNKVCARSLPTKPRKKRPRTVPQQAQANKMKVLSPFLNAVAPFLRVGFKQIATDRNITANNAAKSANMLTGIKGEFPDQEINWDTILVADGPRIKPENVKVTVTKNSFNFTWDKDKTAEGNPNDRAMILLYSKTYGRLLINYSGARRDELKDAVYLDPFYIKKNTYEVFIAFKDVISDEVSKSVYCGRFIN